MSRREGIWDSKVACTITTTIMELEKSDGPVPEQTRLRAIKTTFDLHKRQGKLSFLRATMRVGDAGFVGNGSSGRVGFGDVLGKAQLLC
jgi:hypothetical protein